MRIRKYIILVVLLITAGMIRSQDNPPQEKLIGYFMFFEVDQFGRETAKTEFNNGQKVLTRFYTNDYQGWGFTEVIYEVKNIETGKKTGWMYETSPDSPGLQEVETLQKGRWQMSIFDTKTNKPLGKSEIITVLN